MEQALYKGGFNFFAYLTQTTQTPQTTQTTQTTQTAQTPQATQTTQTAQTTQTTQTTQIAYLNIGCFGGGAIVLLIWLHSDDRFSTAGNNSRLLTITTTSENSIMETIFKHDYTINLISPRKAVVSGGILSRPVTIAKLLGKGDANPKTAKNIVPTVGLSMLPFNFIGFGNVCPNAITCQTACIAHQGQGPMPSVKQSRAAKTVLYYLAREWFLEALNRELTSFRKRHQGIVGARLNMFSDIPWEHHGVIDKNHEIMFYDYTKNPRRWGQVRGNYWVTFSYDGTTANANHAEAILASGGNVSVVYYDEDGKCGRAAHRQSLPSSDMGYDVIDGGVTDWRPGDPRGVIVGLRLLARTYASRNEAIGSGFARLASEGVTV